MTRLQSTPRQAAIASSLMCAAFLCFYYVTANTPDTLRFKGQADSIVSGAGYRTDGTPETFLPPGYPYFLAALKMVGGEDLTFRVFQVALFLLSALFVALSLRKRPGILPAIGAVALAAHPLAATLVGYLLSETLGTFLCASMILSFTYTQSDRIGGPASFLFGCSAMMLALTSPATIPLVLALGAVALGRHLSSREMGRLAAIGLGAGLLLAPWQAHCVRATGKACIYLYSTHPLEMSNKERTTEPLRYWFRTWAIREDDLKVVFSQDVSLAPDYAFDSPAARAHLIASASQDAATRNNALRKAGDANLALRPMWVRFGLPLARFANLWFDMGQIGHFQMSYVGRFSPTAVWRDLQESGPQRALLRVGKALSSTTVYLLYVSYPIFLAAMFVFGILRRNATVLAITLAIGAYTFISAYSAFGEARRNIVFLPAILYMLAFVRFRGDHEAHLRGA